MPLHRSRGVSLLLLAAGTACASPPESSPPEVEYAGCSAVLVPGPVCRLAPQRDLRLWVEAPPNARIEILAGGRPLEAPREPVRGGQRFSLPELPPGAKTIEVLVGRDPPWSLSLAEPESVRQGEPGDVLGEVHRKTLEVYEQIRSRDLVAARKTLAGLRLPAKAPAESRCLLTYYRGLLAEREGDYRSALADVQGAVEIAERLKLEHFQWLAEQELALLLRGVGRSSESAQLFKRLRRKSQARGCEEAQLLNNEAWSTLLAREAGESFEDPSLLFEEALAKYEACATARLDQKVNALLNLALAHLQQGRPRPAKDLLARARALEPHPSLPHRLWWLDLEARIALRERRPEAALRLFDELAEVASKTGSFDGMLRAAFGQARAHRALGHESAALEKLRQAEALLDEQSLQIPVHEGRETFVATRQGIVSLHLEILLAQGRNAEALEVARHARSRVLRQLAHADRLASLPPERRALWVRDLTEYHRRRAALEARAKDDWKLVADQLRHEQDTRRAEAEDAKRLLDQAFLVLGGDGAQPEKASPPPRSGELILAYHPLGGRWIGFAADEETVTVYRFELPPAKAPPTEMARRLLLPLHAQIERAHRVRILASGILQGVDFHALPFAGDVLLASVPVVYGLDLPRALDTAERLGRRALLVVDPRSDLPGARAEARFVRKVLESGPRPWSIEELKAADAAADAVRSRLATADLLHYAGHGTFSGLGGWESSLLLAEETQLTLGDLLALDRVPAWIVLSACDTGRSSAETPIASLGLANAFLLAGSRAVLASTRRADDRKVPGFFAELYRQWNREPDLAVALQRAQLAWRKRNPGADWDSFRLFVP